MTRKQHCAAALLAVASFAAAQSNPPLGSRLKLRWGQSTVTFVEASAAHMISIREEFNAAHLEKVKLESAKESGGFIYLLLNVVGPSKDRPDAHQCGAGSESNLVWLKLDKNWKLVDAKNFRYDSCWSTISVDDGPAWKGDTLTVSADYFKSDGTSGTQTAIYTYKHPEDGLKVVETPRAK